MTTTKSTTAKKAVIVVVVILIVAAIAVTAYMLTNKNSETKKKDYEWEENKEEEHKRHEEEHKKEDEKNEKEYCEKTDIPVPSNIKKIEVIELKASSCLFKWDHPNSEHGVDVYWIEVKRQSNLEVVYLEEIKEDRVNVSNLVPKNNYEITIQVKRCTTKKSELESHIITTRIAPPSNLRTSGLDIDHFRVIWDQYDATFNNKDVYILTITARPDNKVILRKNTTLIDVYVDGLKKNHQYEITLRIFFGGEMSDDVTIKVTTDRCTVKIDDGCQRFVAKKSVACLSDAIQNTCPCLCDQFKEHIHIDR